MGHDGSNPQAGLVETLMRTLWRRPSATVAERSRRRVTVYLLPYLFFLYILAYLDRTNVAVAALHMKKPTGEGGMGFDDGIIGFGAGVFFWGYWILEVPSTLSVLKWGARWVFARILVLWGLACVLVGTIGTPFATSLFSWLPTLDPHAAVLAGTDGGIDFLCGWLPRLFAHDEPLRLLGGMADFINGLPTQPVNQFYFFRFLLGFFEGGFFPSVILYLSLWFRAEHRAKAIACFMAAIPLSSVLGSPLSGLLLAIDWFDLPGWRWIFFLQGVAPVLAGFVTLFFLPDRPEKARWLVGEEREELLAALHQEQQGKHSHSVRAWIGQFGTVVLLTGVYFCLNASGYGLSMFMPAMLKSFFADLDDTWIGVLAALPYVLALAGMLVNGWHSDHTRERIGHVAVPLTCLSMGIAATGLLCSVPWLAALALIVLVGTFIYAHLPAFWPIPTMFLGATAAASAIGFINMVGNLGGSVGPTLVGLIKTRETSFAQALFALAPFPLVSASIILLVGYVRRKKVPTP